MTSSSMLKFAVVGVSVMLAFVAFALVVVPVASASTSAGSSSSGSGHATPAVYPVTFTETGLPTGSAWSVAIGPPPPTPPPPILNASFTIYLPNGTYSYHVMGPPGFAATPSAGSVVVSGSGSTVAIVFSPLPYVVSFTESGLPAGAPWSVVIGGRSTASMLGSSTTATISFPGVRNGTYAFVVPSVRGFSVAPASGNLTVKGAAVSVSIVFTPLPRPTTYAVTFRETGLPAGASWSVGISGSPTAPPPSNGTAISFNLVNGTYGFQVAGPRGYVPIPSHGNVTVAGAPVSVSVSFAALPHPSKYAVTFTETGLPIGSLWAVAVSGTSTAPPPSNGTSVVVSLTNGTYGYQVVGPRGYVPTPSHGNVTVAGAALSVAISFAAASNSVTFTETGLLAGTPWSVVLSSGARSGLFSSTTAAIVVGGLNGTYAYLIVPVPGYSVTPTSGNVTVAGAPASVAVSFTLVGQIVTFTEKGLPAGTAWTVALGPQTISSSKASILIILANGNYSFRVAPAVAIGVNITVYTPTPSHGNLSVSGSPVTVLITFTAGASFPNPGPTPPGGGGRGGGPGPIWWIIIHYLSKRP